MAEAKKRQYTYKWVRQMMRKHNITGQALADALGVHVTTVYRWKSETFQRTTLDYATGELMRRLINDGTIGSK